MLVLCDGQPTAAWQADGIARADPVHALRETVRYIESVKDARIYGIGIQHMGVKDIFKKYVLIHDSNQLDACILDLIDKEFIK